MQVQRTVTAQRLILLACERGSDAAIRLVNRIGNAAEHVRCIPRRRSTNHDQDLKPENIMLGDFGETYVLDWGVARVSRDKPDHDVTPPPDETFATVAGTVLGTPGYIAPEHIRGEREIDGRADVYALGCILFEILAGERLLDIGVDEVALVLAPRDSRPSIRAPGRDIPPELDAICVRAAALERNDRFATARELADAVQRFLDGDRDVALRKSLATGETAAAKAALARGDKVGRQDAIRHAARAMALDPSALEPPVLVARMMLEPPAETPPDVEAELARRDLIDLDKTASYGVLAAVAYLLFLPIVYWVGIRPLWLYIVVPVCAGCVAYAELVLVRRRPILSGRITMVAHLALLASITSAVSPWLIGPAPGCVIIMIMAGQPMIIRTGLIAVCAAFATLGPLVLAQIGWIPTMFATEGDHVILRLGAATATVNETALVRRARGVYNRATRDGNRDRARPG